jgi:hypothetical protein
MVVEWECEECFHVERAKTRPRRCRECDSVHSFSRVVDDDGDDWDDDDYDDDDDEDEDED